MKLMGVIFGGALVLGGVYAYASYDVTERATAFEQDAAKISAGRGGHLPSEADVRTRVEDIAVAQNLELVDLQITFEPLTEANAHRAGPGVAMAQGAAAGVAAKAAGLDASAEAGGVALMEAANQGTLIDITATVRGKKYMVDKTQSITATAFIRHGAQYN